MSATPFPTFGSDDDGTGSPSPPPMDLPTRVYEAEAVVRVGFAGDCGFIRGLHNTNKDWARRYMLAATDNLFGTNGTIVLRLGS